MKRILNHRDELARRIEKLPIGHVNRNMAQANFAAAEAGLDHIAHALAWIRAIVVSMSAEIAPARRRSPARHRA